MLLDFVGAAKASDFCFSFNNDLGTSSKIRGHLAKDKVSSKQSGEIKG